MWILLFLGAIVIMASPANAQSKLAKFKFEEIHALNMRHAEAFETFRLEYKVLIKPFYNDVEFSCEPQIRYETNVEECSRAMVRRALELSRALSGAREQGKSLSWAKEEGGILPIEVLPHVYMRPGSQPTSKP